MGKIMMLLLIMGLFFAVSNSRYRSGYIDGYTVAAVTGETTEGPISAVPDLANHGRSIPGSRSIPGFAPFLLLPLCGMVFLGFLMLMGIGKMAGRRCRQSGGRHGEWSGRGRHGPPWKWDEGGDEGFDDEIGPEKQPEDII